MKKTKKAFNTILTLLFSISILNLNILFLAGNEVKASSQLILNATADAMVRENVPNYNYGAWNDMTVGEAYNYGSYFSNAYAYIKFDTSQLDNQSIIDSAYLDIYQYVRSDYASGNYLVQASKVTGNWQEMGITWNNKPAYSGNYGQVWADGFAGQWFRPPKKYTINVTGLVREWAGGSPNYGVVLRMVSGNLGGFWCSRNYNNSTCFSYSQPKLIVNYRQNHPPNTPNPHSPENLAEFGGDSSGGGRDVTLKVKDLGDPEDNYDGTWFYYKKQNDSSWSISPKRTGRTQAQYTRDFSDGKWLWKARSRDVKGLWSNFSVTRTFFVDTTAPTQPSVQPEPQFSPGNQNTVVSTESVDNLLGEVKYKFRVLKGEECTLYQMESDWQSSKDFTATELEHDATYCYQVKSKDKIGNQNDWGEFERSIQDAVFPQIVDVSLNNEIFSPNDDGKYDTTTFSFQIVEENFEVWQIVIKNSLNENVQTFKGTSLSKEVVWNGKDDSGNTVEDGAYAFYLSAADQAGNTTVNDQKVVIVDNQPATLNISQPKDGSWFSTEAVTISGITEPNIFSLTLNSKSIDVDENGIFEESEEISLGNNEFDLVAVDIVGNTTNKTLTVKKELTSPIVDFTQPSSVTNNNQPVIAINLHESSQEQSGINAETVFLSLTNSDGNELVLVSGGQNLQPELGEKETDCGGDKTGGSIDCTFNYRFISPLQPDGLYQLASKVSDMAGNKSDLEEYQFILDSHTFLEVNSPEDGSVISGSKIDIFGTGEKGSLLEITGTKDVRSILIDPSDENITNCREADESWGPGWQGVGQVCDFTVKDFELEADFENDVYVENTINFELTDSAENTITTDLVLKVNLFAVDLSIKSDLEYISPNGDGRQDGLNFTMKALNRDNKNEEVNVSSWKIIITNEKGELINILQGANSLPANYFYDGRDEHDNWLNDGTYFFNLQIETSDGIQFETERQAFYVVLELDGRVVITTPKDGQVTTRGVVNVQGQAPNDTVVTICVDMIGVAGDCNDEQVVEVDQKGFFTGIVPLATKESYLWAEAVDRSGNLTPPSNKVKVILDYTDPLVNIQALPSISGINQDIILRSLVTQNTEYVEFEFTDYTNLDELPQETDWEYIGKIDDFDDDDFNDSCTQSQCIWDKSWTIPEVVGGVYEINFTAKKGETINKMSLGVRIDGTIPVVPTILSLINSRNQKELREHNSHYYSNNNSNKLSGIAEPLSFVHVLAGEEELIKVKANALGKWFAQIVFDCGQDNCSYEITAVSSDNVGNQSGESVSKIIVIDKKLPIFENLETSNKYRQSGSVADVALQSDEDIYASIIKRHDGSLFDMHVSNVYSQYVGSFVIESKAREGKYETAITIEDFAGNVSSQSIGFIIDNTSPEKTSVDTTDWGKHNGIYFRKQFPAQGRLVPEFVTSNSTLEIIGRAEKYSLIQIWKNSKILKEVPVSNKNCSGEVLAYGQTLYPVCDWNFKIDLGKEERGNLLQVKVIDRAGNKSEVSGSETVYLDKTRPKKAKEVVSGDYVLDHIGRVTNKTKVRLILNCEKLSDMQVWVEKDKYSDHRFEKCNRFGNLSLLVNLGKEETSKWDGNYSVKVASTDAAGNQSEKTSFIVEKDTIAPLRPKIKLHSKEDEKRLALSVSGEKNTKVLVHIYRNGIDIDTKEYTMDDSNRCYINYFTRWMWAASYRVEVSLKDRAGNFSSFSSATYTTPYAPMGDVDTPLVQGEEDPYSGVGKDKTGKLTGEAKVRSDGRVELNLSVPAPIIVSTKTYSNASVDIWGLATTSGNIKVDFYKNHKKDYVKDMQKATQMCGWQKFIPYINSFYIPKCIRENYQKIQNQEEYSHTLNSFQFAPQNAVVQIYRNGKRVGKEFPVNIANGRWKATFKNGLNSGDIVSAKVRVWGYYIADGARIGYNHGSGLGNKVAIKKIAKAKPYFHNVYSVLGDNYYYNEVITQKAFGSYSHVDNAALDISSGNGTEVYASMDGVAEYIGEGVWLNNDQSDYKLLYAHLSTSSKSLYPTNNMKKVKKGEVIGYIGNLRHVHYEIFHKNLSWPYTTDCNSQVWKNWRQNMKGYLQKIAIPYDNVVYYSTYLGQKLYANGKSLNLSKSNCPQN